MFIFYSATCRLPKKKKVFAGVIIGGLSYGPTPHMLIVDSIYYILLQPRDACILYAALRGNAKHATIEETMSNHCTKVIRPLQII